MSIGNNIKKLREARGVTQVELAEILGVSNKTVSTWELGLKTPRMGALEKMCEYFGVKKSDILDDKPEIKPKRQVMKIPVYGRVAAGIPIEAIEDIIDYEEVYADEYSDGDYFALEIKGDSMEPRISSGDVVIVRRQPDVENGDIAIVLVNGDEATCKKILKQKNGVMLISTNQNYRPMFFSNKEIEELPVTVLGRVVELRAKF